MLANDNDQLAFLSQFCASEAWSGDLASGLLKIGEKALAHHGLSNNECGLLNLIRCYETIDRNKILELFEQATTHSSSFCFSTTIHKSNGTRQPVFCVGESTGLEKKFSGSILGVFLFPHFELESGSITTGPVFSSQ